MNTRRYVAFLVVAAALATTLTAIPSGQSNTEAKALAERGLAAFREVLAGDRSQYASALKDLESARTANAKDVDNLYVLARAYFYDGTVYNNLQSIQKSKVILEEMLAIEPQNSEALSFHGSILTAESRGQDMAMFMKGVAEMNKAIEAAPQNPNNLIVRPFTARNFPPPALQAIGKDYDPVQDLRKVSKMFDANAFFYAPHAQVVMRAIIGDTLISQGKSDQGVQELQAALAYAQPASPKEKAARAVLDDLIQKRIGGETRPLMSGLMGTCYSCHLTHADKIKTQ